MHDFDVVLVSDCIAGVNQTWDEFAREVWQFYIGEVVQLEDVKAMIYAGSNEFAPTSVS